MPRIFSSSVYDAAPDAALVDLLELTLELRDGLLEMPRGTDTTAAALLVAECAPLAYALSDPELREEFLALLGLPQADRPRGVEAGRAGVLKA